MRHCTLYRTHISHTFIEFVSSSPVSVLQKVNPRSIDFKQPEDLARHIAGRALIYYNLTQSHKQSAAPYSISFNKHGKPHLPGFADFNISHSGSYVICALCSNGKIGTDIEKIKPVCFDDFKQAFSQDEWEYILRASAPTTAFYELWTKKEAILKAAGSGLTDELSSVEVLQEIIAFSGKHFHLYPLSISSGYKVHIASDEPLLSIADIYISESQLINTVFNSDMKEAAVL